MHLCIGVIIKRIKVIINNKCVAYVTELATHLLFIMKRTLKAGKILLLSELQTV